MKKIVLSLAGVMAAVAFAPEASAVPVFARQTGMACTACHFQHFPAINGFGRAFKAAGFTMMGAQEKVEGEHLSIPATLNMAILATAGIDAAQGVQSNLFVPNGGGELQIFFGGKVNDFSGWLSELGTGATGSASGKLHIMPEVAPGIHAGVSIFNIGQGAGGVMEMLNTGATSIHRLMGKTGAGTVTNGGGKIHNEAASARQYIAPEGGGTGAAINVVADNFAVTVAREAQATAISAPGSVGALNSQYIRAVFMTDIAGFDSGFGIQHFSGNSNAQTGLIGQKAYILDAQMQGQVGEMPLGVYASYGNASADLTGNNKYNLLGTQAKTSFNIAGELGIVPGVATVQLALRQGNTGAAINGGDNAIMIGATYELSMNMELGLHYTKNSGSAWTAVPTGNSATTFLLETLF